MTYITPGGHGGKRPLFYKRHNIAIAEALRAVADTHARSLAFTALADMFEDDNPNFNREIFCRECGL